MAQCKYAMREHQISYDDGFSWISLEVIKGDLIEYQSADCPDSGSEITKWVDLENDFICEDNRKYKKQVLYVSYDGGVTWYIDYPTVYRQGEYVGIDEAFCNNKFEGHYEEGDCGSSTQRPTGGGDWGSKNLNPDPLKIVKCNDNSTLTRSETRYYVSCYRLLSAKIGKCVSEIEQGCFSGDTLSSITITSGDINDNVFSGCSRLSNVIMGSGVTYIGKYAFYDCSGLTNINIPNSVTRTGDLCFRKCSSLPVVDDVRYADTYAVEAVDKTLATYTLKPNTRFIGSYSFNSSGLTSMNIPNTVIEICDDAFAGCSALSSVTISNPSQLKRIKDGAFSGCKKLSYINLPSTILEIGDYAFNNCSALTCSLDAYTQLTSIGKYAFNNCRSLENINIPDSVTSIGKDAFYRCCGALSVTIGNGASIIGESAFEYCTGLTSITIGSGVTRIDQHSFANCTSLTSITINAETPPRFIYTSSTQTTADAFENTNYCPIYVPCGKVNTYKKAVGWSTYEYRIYENPSCPQYRTISTGWTCVGVNKYTLEEYQVSYDSGSTWTTTATSATTLIEANSTDCGYATRTISTGWTCVGYDKYTLTEYQVSYDSGSTWTTTGTSATTLIEANSEDCGYGNKLVSEYSNGRTYTLLCNDSSTLSESETSPSGYYITAMTSAVIGKCVTKIGSYAFSGCTNLTSVDITSGLTIIGEGAFVDCKKLTSINIPSGVTSIGESAFRGCSGITSIDIPNSVTSINNAICSGCTSLTNINIPSGVTSIGSDAFYKCTSLTSIVIPDSVTSIGNYAFQQCSGLTSCTIGSGVTSIGSQAFYIYTNPSLISITINAITPPSINSSDVFGNYNCPIYVPSDSVNAYKTAENWTRYANRIQAIP